SFNGKVYTGHGLAMIEMLPCGTRHLVGQAHFGAGSNLSDELEDVFADDEQAIRITVNCMVYHQGSASRCRFQTTLGDAQGFDDGLEHLVIYFHGGNPWRQEAQ